MLTFGPMIDSELSRLVLWRYGLPFREERHIFGWVSILALLRGGTGRIPLIYAHGVRLNGPRAVIDRYELLCEPGQILIPATQPLRTRVEDDWIKFNGDLATHTARIAYFHLLPRRELLLDPFERGIPPVEARITPALYPALRELFTLLLRLYPKVISDSVDHAKRIVDEVDYRVADGRRFLHGEAVTLSDFSFATAAAPMMLPDGYTSPFPCYDQLPPKMKLIVDSFRERPSSALVGRVYGLRALPEADSVSLGDTQSL